MNKKDLFCIMLGLCMLLCVGYLYDENKELKERIGWKDAQLKQQEIEVEHYLNRLNKAQERVIELQGRLPVGKRIPEDRGQIIMSGDSRIDSSSFLLYKLPKRSRQ